MRSTPTPPIIVDDEPDFEISEILDSKIDNQCRTCKLLYLSDGQGYEGTDRNFLDPRFRRLRCISSQFEVLLSFQSLQA